MSTKCRTCDKACSYRTGDYVPEYVALLARHNALVEAVAWERECDDTWYSDNFPLKAPALYELFSTYEAARAEVDKLLTIPPPHG